jgi:hypothetical protein
MEFDRTTVKDNCWHCKKVVPAFSPYWYERLGPNVESRVICESCVDNYDEILVEKIDPKHMAKIIKEMSQIIATKCNAPILPEEV